MYGNVLTYCISYPFHPFTPTSPLPPLCGSEHDIGARENTPLSFHTTEHTCVLVNGFRILMFPLTYQIWFDYCLICDRVIVFTLRNYRSRNASFIVSRSRNIKSILCEIPATFLQNIILLQWNLFNTSWSTWLFLLRRI